MKKKLFSKSEKKPDTGEEHYLGCPIWRLFYTVNEKKKIKSVPSYIPFQHLWKNAEIQPVLLQRALYLTNRQGLIY